VNLKLKLETRLSTLDASTSRRSLPSPKLENKILLSVRECLDSGRASFVDILGARGMPRFSDGNPRRQRSRPRVATQ
jgi:hypothetical protein